MDLLVIITGLVLLVPDRANQQIHLVFPAADTAQLMEHHTPFIRYPRSDVYDSVALTNFTLDLSRLSQPGNASALPSHIMKLEPLFKGGFKQSWISHTPPNAVDGRVTLPWPEAFGIDSIAQWLRISDTRAERILITNSVTLYYQTLQPSGANWELKRLPKSPGSNILIAPASDTDSHPDTLFIGNVPDGGGPELRNGDEGVHFQGYVGLLRHPTEHKRQIPRLYIDDPRVNSRGFSPYNCMLAEAPIRP